MWFYRFARMLLKGFFKMIFRLEAEGLHHIPASGPVILCSNHVSNWDPPIVGVPVPRIVRFMAKEELFRFKPLGFLISTLGAFPVKRGGVSKESIRMAINLLKSGEMLSIFPEGSRGGGMGKKGAASLALRSNATVVPAAIIGDFKLFHKVRVIYGEPVDLSAFTGETSESQEQATEHIMSHIRELVKKHS